MQKIILSFFILLLFLQTLLHANTTYHDNNTTKEKVSIQFKWTHSFQFAGYYAALEKGFYADEGLDVTFKERDLNRDFIKDVINGHSEYGISDSSLMIYHLENDPVVLVAQIFQHSPLVFISHRDSNITTPYEMVGKKASYSVNGSGDAPLRALILKTIGDFKKLDISNFTNYQQGFIERKVDVTSALSTAQPYWLKKQGVDVNVIDPKSYGIDFYGDNLFTTQKELKEHPLRVKKMKRATIKGWEYALSHQDEIIDLILKKYIPTKKKDSLEFEARGTYQMIMPDLTEIGSFSKEKYAQVATTYHQLGMVESDKIDDNFFYHDKKDTLSLTPKEKQWIADNPMIKLAVMQYWESDGEGNNVHIDMIKLLNKYGNLNITPVKFDAWKEGYAEASNGQNIHGITNVSRSIERDKDFLFTQAYNFLPSHLIVKNDNYTTKSLDDLENKTIYLKEKIIAHQLVKDMAKNIKVINVKTDDEIYKKLSTSNDAIAAISYSIDRQKLKEHNLKVTKATYDQYGAVHIAVSHKHPELQSILNKIFKLIPSDKLTSLQHKNYVINKHKTIHLTKEEKAWIKEHPTVIVGGEKDWAPIDFVNDAGVHDGLSYELLKLIEEKVGLVFNYELGTWENLLKKLKHEEIDILPALYHSKERSAYMHFTEPYMNLNDYIFVHTDLDIKDLSDLDGKVAAIPKDYIYKERLSQHYPNIKVLDVASGDKAIEAVLTHKADMLADTYAVLNYKLKIQGIKSIKPFKAMKNSNLRMATSHKNPLLASILTKALATISDEKKEEILSKWIGKKEKQKYNIKLTKEEQNWLQSNEDISFAGNPNWLPFEAFDESGKYIGIVADYLQSIEQLVPLKFNPLKTKDWSQTMAHAKKGEVDIISEDITSTPLKKHYNPIPAYIKSPLVILMRGDNGFVDDIPDISDKKIALIVDYGFNDTLKATYPNQTFVYEKNADIALESLSSGKIDAVILSMPKAQYLISLQGYKSIKIVGKTKVNLNLTLFIHKDKPELYTIIKKTMRKLSNTKHLEILSRWQEVEFAKKIDYTLLYQIAGILGFFLLGTFYWNRKLSTEITKRKESENALQESKTQIQTLIDNIPLQILVTSYDGKLLMVNPQTLKDHGRTKEDMQKHNMSDFYADPKEREEVINELQTKRRVDQKIIKFKHLDQSIYSMMVSILPITYKKQNALLSIAVDLSQRLEMEKALSLAKEEAEAANLAKSEFLANMSHEIRTPMNSVMGFSELLAKQITDPIQKDYLDSIQRGGDTLLNIINDILDLSKIEAGKLEMVLESVDIKQLALEMESIFSVKLIQKNIHFELDIDPSLPKYLLLDNTRIRQILFNLIGNAIKFTPHGFVKLSILKSNEKVEKSKIDLEISVQDSGIGIPEKNLKHIFSAFEQQKGQDNQKYGGTGLGLTISKKLANMMNGTISVESEVDVGSTFTINLSDIPISSMEANLTQKRKPLDALKFKKATILIVDDIKDNRKLVASTLGEYDLDFIEAENGKEAIELLRNVKVDLVFMDIKMPVMDGYAATKIIKEDTKLKEIPIIALTASVMGKDLEKIKEYSFDGYLRKPVSQDDLVMQMERFLAYDVLELTNKQTNDIDAHAYNNLPKVLQALETEHTKTWNEIKEMGDFSLIFDFSKSLEDLGAKNGINILTQYAKELQINCDSFDIDKIDFMMNSFQPLIEKLKNIQEAQT